jgi:hypothetical protein
MNQVGEPTRAARRYIRWMKYFEIFGTNDQKKHIRNVVLSQGHTEAYHFLRQFMSSRLEELITISDGGLVAKILSHLPVSDLRHMCSSSSAIEEVCKRYNLKQRRANLGRAMLLFSSDRFRMPDEATMEKFFKALEKFPHRIVKWIPSLPEALIMTENGELYFMHERSGKSPYTHLRITGNRVVDIGKSIKTNQFFVATIGFLLVFTKADLLNHVKGDKLKVSTYAVYPTSKGGLNTAISIYDDKHYAVIGHHSLYLTAPPGVITDGSVLPTITPQTRGLFYVQATFVSVWKNSFVVVAKDGKLYGVGDNKYFCLGLPDENVTYTELTQIDILNNDEPIVKAILYARSMHVITASGNCFACGRSIGFALKVAPSRLRPIGGNVWVVPQLVPVVLYHIKVADVVIGKWVTTYVPKEYGAIFYTYNHITEYFHEASLDKARLVSVHTEGDLSYGVMHVLDDSLLPIGSLACI